MLTYQKHKYPLLDVIALIQVVGKRANRKPLNQATMKKNLLKIYVTSILFLLLSILMLSTQAQTVNTYTSSTTWVSPFTGNVRVECWGGGGAGGGANTRLTAGGGGGGGAFTINNSFAVTAGTTYTITVGAGGNGGTGNGGNGGNSVFSGTSSSVTANGGAGGFASTVTNGVGNGGAGGTGGTFNGGTGRNAVRLFTTFQTGTGGGGASTAANGADGIAGGAGGAVGGGNGGAGVTSAFSQTGAAGAIIGGGGAGAFRDNSAGSNRTGGNGARGQVRVTYTITTCLTPASQPTSLVLAPGVNDIGGTFLNSANANGYLVVMTTTATAPSSPVNGTTYTAGTNALGGRIIYSGSNNNFVATGLAATTQYWFWIFAYNGPTGCTGTITYNTVAPLNGTATTVACGLATNTATITNTAGSTYSAGTNTYTINWSSLSWSLGHVPTNCENVLIVLDRTMAATDENVTINLNVNFSIRNMTMRNISNTARKIVLATSGLSTAVIDGNLTMECPGGPLSNPFNRCVFSNQTSTTINGNVTLGRNGLLTTPTEGHSAIGSNGTTPNQLYTMFGDFTFNPRGYTTDEWAVFAFNKAGTQYIYNNTRALAADTSLAVLFEDLRIGTTNATTVVMGGTQFDGYIENVGRAGITIGVNSTLDLPENYSLNRILGGNASYLRMLAGSRLRLGGDRSMPEVSGPGIGTNHGLAGSNFPNGLTPITLDPTSTIEYYGRSGITQTIYNLPNYANLVASNGPGTGRAQKITTAPLNIVTSFNINANTDVTLGTAGSSTFTVACAGPLNVNSTGGLYCNANVISGAGAFTTASASTLGMGHAQGIAPTGSANGNIQMTGTRTYSTAGNYTYNGIVNQITGTGLPASAVNNLTIDNANTVTIANNQLVNGIINLNQGTFNIGTTRIVSNGSGLITSNTGKMKADLGSVEMRGTAGVQNLSGNWFVNKTIANLTNANSTGITVAAVPADTLLISTTLDYGVSTTGSTTNTNDNLTLLSRTTGTANFGNSTGNAITGRVNVERFLPARAAWRFLATPVVIGTSPTIASAWREGNAALASSGYGTRVTGPTGPFGATGVLDQFTQRGSMKSFNSTTNVWDEVANANTALLANTKGYMTFVRGDRAVNIGGNGSTILRIKGDLRTGSQTFAIPANKFESFGNPYASRIDFRNSLKTNIANAFIVWNPNSAGAYNVGAYETYVFDGTNYRRGATIRNTIESGEAVFVQSNVATAGLIVVRETDKGVGSANVSRVGVTIPTLEINLFAQNTDGSTFLADAAMLNFNNQFSNNVDNNDVRKILNTYDNIGIKNGVYNLVVERRPNLLATDSIKLFISGMRVAPYKLEIDPSVLSNTGLEAIFKDKYLQTETPMSFTDVTTINFTCTADALSRVNDRFVIVFKQAPTTNFANIKATRNADNTVTVNWGTNAESNVSEYTLEQSNDAINFTAVTTQAPQANNGNNVTYTKLDATASLNKNWYRVKATHAGGTVKYSSIAMVNEVITTTINVEPSVSVYPNPIVNGNVNVYFKNKANGKYSLNVVNSLGQVLHTSVVNVTNNNTLQPIKLAQLQTGKYNLQIVDEQGMKTNISLLAK
jgi:hypothetical protein